jgi:glycosyltransferase involved in cell wall biosynthesis
LLFPSSTSKISAVKLSLVVPCYNEARRFDAKAWADALLRIDSLQLLFVNDGSRDETATMLARFVAEQPRARLLDLPKNQGKAEAVRQGMLAALDDGGEFIGFWDADLATPLDEVPRFVEVFRLHPELDMVLGSRVKLMGRNITRRASRHYLGRVAATAISNTLGLAIYDTQCGAKLFRNDAALREVISSPFVTRWIFDVELLARYIDVHRRQRETVAERIYELPLMTWRDIEGSKVRAGDFFRAAIDLWKIERRYHPRRK